MANSNAASPDFDSIKQLNPYGTEYWSARELAPLLGYNTWQNFEKAINRAITSCEQVSQSPDYHFSGATKAIQAGKGAVQNVCATKFTSIDTAFALE